QPKLPLQRLRTAGAPTGSTAPDRQPDPTGAAIVRRSPPMNRPASALGFPAALAAAALALVAPVFAPAAAAQGTPPATTAPAAAPELPRVPPPADLPRDRPLRAAFLVLEGVSGTELVATYDVLQHTVAATRPGITVY